MIEQDVAFSQTNQVVETYVAAVALDRIHRRSAEYGVWRSQWCQHARRKWQVTSDGLVDNLSGESGRDWFFDQGDNLVDRVATNPGKEFVD